MRTLTKTVRLHPAQAAFRRSKALYRGFVGGRGAGKSWVAAYDLIRRARRGRTYLFASPTYTILSDSDFRTFRQIARSLDVLGEYKASPPSAMLTTGAEILFRSADDPEKLRGPNLSGVVLCEASLMHRDAYDIAIACLREQGEQGWLSAAFTPKGLSHWTFDVWGGTKPDTEIFHARTQDNPFNPAGFAETLRQQYSGTLAQQELEGQFVNVEGAEWPAEFFGPKIWFDDWPPDINLKVLSLDPSKGKGDASGDYSAFILLGLDNDWTLWVDADLDNTRPVESTHGGRSILGDGMVIFDKWRPDAFLIETNGFQELVANAFKRVSDERRLHLPLYQVCNTSPKVQRIRKLGTYLAQGRIRVRNTPGGRLLVQQLRDFPVGEHDDAPDALSSGVRMMDRLLGAQGGPDAPQLVRG